MSYDVLGFYVEIRLKLSLYPLLVIRPHSPMTQFGYGPTSNRSIWTDIEYGRVGTDNAVVKH